MKVLTGNDQTELYSDLAMEHLKKVAGMSILFELALDKENLFDFGIHFFDAA